MSKALSQWCRAKRFELQFIQPGKPMQNGYIERFNRTYREDVLDAHLFRDIEEVNLETERFRKEYNCFHPHKSLGRSSPKEYLEEFSKGMPL
ncbi:MAG: integrase core domain-containing protein [Flagellimonas sp.]